MGVLLEARFVDSVSIKIGWPNSDLLPNSRKHWSARATAARYLRQEAYLLTPKIELPEGDLEMVIDIYPPDNRHRDVDGIISSVKAGIDGLCEKVGVDDHRIKRFVVERHSRITGIISLTLRRFLT